MVGEVGEHTARPTFYNVRHTDFGSFGSENFFRLFFGGDEEYLFARFGDLFQRSSCFVDFGDRFVKVDDVDTVTLHEDVRSHSRVPFSFQVAKVYAGF